MTYRKVHGNPTPSCDNKKTTSINERVREHTFEGLYEQVAILRNFQRANGSAQNPNTEPVKHTHPVEFNTDVESALAAEGEQDTVRTFLFQDIGDIIRGG